MSCSTKPILGVTDFGEKVNYRRALEGEFERSIKAINAIESARVHITFPKDSVFLDSREPAKASVLVSCVPAQLWNRKTWSPSAIWWAARWKVFRPMPSPWSTCEATLLSKRKRSGDGADSGDALLDYRHQVEKDLTAKVEATLEPLLGEGRFRVGVSADCDISTSEQTDETYDPTRSVMSTSQKTEDLSNNSAIGRGARHAFESASLDHQTAGAGGSAAACRGAPKAWRLKLRAACAK